MDKDRIKTKVKIFRTLNGRDMKILDYMQNASEEEMISILQQIFECNMNQAKILEILNSKIIDIVID